MTEQFILEYIPGRVRRLGYSKYHIRYKDLNIPPSVTTVFDAYNELYFVIGDPQDISIESSYGVYDTTGDPTASNVHEHRGEITVSNRGDESRRVKFVQVIIVN